MKRIFLRLIALFFIALISCSAFSADEAEKKSLNVIHFKSAFLTNYLLRGLPVIGEHPTITLNAEYDFSRRFYAGSWLGFPFNTNLLAPQMDLYFGYVYRFLGLYWDSGFIRYDVIDNARFPVSTEFFTVAHLEEMEFSFFWSAENESAYYFNVLKEHQINERYVLAVDVGYWLKASEANAVNGEVNNATNFSLKAKRLLSADKTLFIAWHNQHESGFSNQYWLAGFEFEL